MPLTLALLTCFTSATYKRELLERHDGSDALALMHQMKRVIDLIKRHGVSDHLVNIDFPLHAPVDDLGDVRSTSCTTERGTAPGPPRHQLEGACGNFLSCTGHTNNAALPPSLVTALKSLAHDIHVTNALKTVINTTTGHLNQVVDDVLHLARINKIRHTELPRELRLGRIQIDTNDTRCTHHASALNDVETNATEAEYSNCRARFDFHCERHGTNTSRYTTADVTNLVKGGILSDFGHRDFGQHGEVGKRRASHVIENRLAIQSEPTRMIRH